MSKRSSTICAIAVWLICFYCVFTKAAGQQINEQKLAPNTPIERNISGGETHNYGIVLEAGHGIKIKVEQRGVDVILELSGPDGKMLLKENGWEETRGTEQIIWATQVGGKHQLRIYTAEMEVAAGRYEIKTEVFPTDSRIINAIQKFNEGLQLEKDKKLDQSLTRFEESIELWHGVGDWDMEGRSLFYASSLAYQTSILPKALSYSLRALDIFRSLGMKKEEYVTLSFVASSYSSMGDFPKSLFYDQQRIPLLSLVSPNAVINLYLNLGINSRQIGDYSKAHEHLGEALQRARNLQSKSQELLVLSALATLYYVTNEPMKSLEYINSALPLSRNLKQPIREGRLLVQLGQIYNQASEPLQAINFLNQALLLTNTPEGRIERMQTLMLLGESQEQVGNIAAALESFDQALALSRFTKSQVTEMRTLMRIGSIISSRGEYKKALEHQQQAIAFFHANGQRREEAQALIDLAQTYEKMGQKEKAYETLDQALILVRTLAGRSGEADILRMQSLLAYENGDLKKALALIETGIQSREELRKRFVGPSFKASYSASTQNFYETYINILMRIHEQFPREGYDALAFSASENARARGLLDLLAESRAEIRQGADPSLLEKERNLQQLLSDKETAYRNLIDNSRIAVSAKTVAQEINDLAIQLQIVEAEIRSSNSRYAALTQPRPLNITEVQGLLDNDTILLEFTLGEKQSWMWAVTPGSLESFRLPPRLEIEAATRQFYEDLTARQPKTHESSIMYTARVAEADAKFQREAIALSSMLLAPIAPRLSSDWNGKRLVIVASGTLEYLPFAALPVPIIPQADKKEPDGYRSLITAHEIVNLPSAAVIALIRRESVNRRKATGILAILADPVFEANDPRVLMSARKREQAGKPVVSVKSESTSPITPVISSDLMRSVRSFNRSGFSKLPFSRIEAEAISTMVPRTKLLKATDFKASRATAASNDLANYRIIHFATHGLLNGEHPELSGLVLSLVDKNGKGQDGFLRMNEIYNLRLPVDLVVLSACQTAIGKETKGEGLAGLTRSFMYAGTERVIASLWQVDDLATSELMKRFYSAMLTKKMRPAAALRTAQIEMKKQKRWANPYFWAGFTIQGEWQ